jgi:N-acetylneuraminate synthase/N,N'-diacetyllegionaminate synthase
MIVSTGMHDMATVRKTSELLKECNAEFMFLYCVSEYPTEPSDFNLGLIDRMRSEFDVPVGFSDHSQGIEAAVTAMARGADFVEKHFTLDRRLPGGDQEVSIEPDELVELTAYANLVHQTGGFEREIRSAEESIRGWAHHSVVTPKSIPAGTQFTMDNVTTKRPGTGIPATQYFDLIGNTATRSIESNTILNDSDINW